MSCGFAAEAVRYNRVKLYSSMIRVSSCFFCFSTTSMHRNLELRCNSLNWPSSALTCFFQQSILKKSELCEWLRG